MKSLLWTETCLHHPNYGQAALWRWWYYYQQHKDAMGITHFAAFNNGDSNLPVEYFAPKHDGAQPIPDFAPDRLNVVYWKEFLEWRDVHNRPSFWRNLATATDLCFKQGIDRFILIATDAVILSPEMLYEIGKTEVGAVAYWSPHHNIPETAICIVGKDYYNHFSKRAKELLIKPQCTEADRFESCVDWTVIRTHRKGDRYPEFTHSIPGDAEYCCQLGIQGRISPSHHVEAIS